VGTVVRVPKVAMYTDGSTKTLRRYRAVVVGGIWMPYGATASYVYKFDAEDNEEAMSRIDCEAGDFSSVDDFELSMWGELCPHCHSQGWLLVKALTPEGEDTYFETIA